MNDMVTLWKECLSILEEELSPVSFTTWFKDLVPVRKDDNTFVLSAKNQIIRQMVSSRYTDLIKNILSEITGKFFDIEYVVGEESPVEDVKKVKDSPYSNLTFENFVIGNSNRFAQSAALAVAEEPAYSFNPLFLYGGVGLGKTHLMHAIGNHIKMKNNDAQVKFITAEQFTTELINSIQENKKQEFRDRYRNIDVLLVDDIQFIAGKTATEEEFFHTFNALHEAKKQIVLTSDRPPSEIKTLEERLRSRFGWGLICDIQPPDYETRVAILRKKAEEARFLISDEILNFTAQKVSSNIRDLEGILNKFIAYRALINRDITLDVAIDILKEYGEMAEKKITPDYIIETCAKFYGVKKEDIYTDKRTKNIALARQVSIYIMKELTDYSYPKIGSLVGKDHSTAIYAIKKVNELMEKDPGAKFNIEGLINDIKGESN